MNWLKGNLRKRKRESQLDSELRFHIEQRTADLIADGVEASEAHRRAMIEFGGMEGVKEECRQTRGTYFVEGVVQDVRYALRTLRNSRGFAAIATLTLALGIGANLAMFAILNAWLLEPLPFPHSNRIVLAALSDPKRPHEPAAFDAYRDFLVWRGANQSFSSIGGAFWHNYVLTGHGPAHGLFGMIVTRGFFKTLQVRPELGRTFQPADLRGPPAVVLSDSLWREDFDASRDILGKAIALSGKPYVVVGVMPRHFDFRISNQPKGAQLWTLIQPDTSNYGPNGRGPIAVIGRLRQGVRAADARSELSVIFRRLEVSSPDGLRHLRVSVSSLQSLDTQPVRSSLFLGEASVAFLLLLVCANLAGLLLSRAEHRGKEMAVRAALGSSRGRLLRQLLTENAILALLGAGVGVLVAEACLRAFLAANPLGTLPPHPIGLDGRTAALAILLAVLTASLLVFPAALRLSLLDPGEGLREGSRGVSAGRRATNGQRALVVAEIAVAVVLATGASLLTRTLLRLLNQPLGFKTTNVTMLDMSLPGSLTANASEREMFYDRLVSALRALPGVGDFGISNCSMLYCGQTQLQTGGHSSAAGGGISRAAEQAVSPGFFASLGIPLLRGRSFVRSDDGESLPVAILNRSAAMALGIRNPIGKRVRLGKKGRWRTVIGIVGDTRSIDYTALGWQVQPRAYIPLAQASSAKPNAMGGILFVSLRGRAGWTDGEIRRAVASASDQVPVSVYPLSEMLTEQFQQPESRAMFLDAFGFIGLLLVGLGVYGVLAQAVSRRTREIGIRVAVGARRADILRLVVWKAAKLVFAGMALGIAGALALSRLIASLLYGVKPTDPVLLAGVLVLILAVGLAACYFPARRALRVDPTVALRYE